MVEGFHAPCRGVVSFPDRMLPLSAFRRFSLSRPSFPKTARVIRSVLVRSNNRRPSGPLRFACGSKPPANYFTRLAAASHRGLSPGSIFACRWARERPSVEPVNPASFTRGLRHRSKRDRTNQPGPIFPRSPGIILNGLADNFHFQPPVVLSMNGEQANRISRSVN